MSEDKDVINFKGLKALTSLLENDELRTKIGILGAKNLRNTDPNKTNAGIGAKHEFGDSEVPRRSFLRVPLADNLFSYIESSKSFNKELVDECLEEGTLKPLYLKMGVIAETVILDAFESGGFGKWKPSNMKYKKNHQTLVETQQLRNSITSEVV